MIRFRLKTALFFITWLWWGKDGEKAEGMRDGDLVRLVAVRDWLGVLRVRSGGQRTGGWKAWEARWGTETLCGPRQGDRRPQRADLPPAVLRA